MKLHPTGTDPTGEARLVCRNVRFGLIVLLAVFWGAAIFWWWVEAPLWVTAMCGLVALFLTPLLIGAWRKRGRPENWVLATYPDGLWLNLRYCEHYLAEPGDTVLFVPYREILAAKKFVHRYKVPGSDGGSISHRDVYLDLEIVSPNSEALASALKAERNRSAPPRKYLWGLVTVSDKKIASQPVQLLGEDLLRIKFKSQYIVLRPALKRVLAELSEYVSIEEQASPIVHSSTDNDEENYHELVCDLVRQGKTISAIRVLREKRNLTLTEARQFVGRNERTDGGIVGLMGNADEY